jgi:MarR family transcriptional regulator for hemolysin
MGARLPEPTEQQQALATAMTVAARSWRARLNERLKGLGQTDARLTALQALAAAPPGLTQWQLAASLGVEEPTLVRLLDALEAQGWVSREPHAHDRRSKVVRLTPEAAGPLRQWDDVLKELADAFRGIPTPDLEASARVLETVVLRLDRSRR